MKALRADLNGMGSELAALKNVLEDMLRHGEAGRRWEREEAERQAQMARRAEDERARAAEHERRRKSTTPASLEDPDLTPKATHKTWAWSDTPASPPADVSLRALRSRGAFEADVRP